ncbi:MAG: glycosyltransferase family 39 protein [Bacteroidota bacterium]
MDIAQLPRNRYIWGTFLMLLLAALLINLGLVSLQFEEPRRAIVAMEMMLSGDYFVPKINGFLYYNKPPVFNWIIILFATLFGSMSEWVVRLPTVLSLLAITGINFWVINKKIDFQTAVHSSLIFVTTTNILFYFSFQGEIDMFYSLIVYLQIICLLHYFEKERYFELFIYSYALTGIGVLTKGIPSLAFQSITILTLFIYHRRFRALFSVWNFVGIALMIGIIGGYFYRYSLSTDPLPMITRLITESSKRTVAEESLLSSVINLYKFPLLLVTMMLPWSVLPFSTRLRSAWSEAWKVQWFRFSVLFIAANVVIYWLSPGARDRYLYMFIPFIGVVMAVLFIKSPGQLMSWTILLFEGILLIGSFAIPVFSKELSLTHNILVAAYLFIVSGSFIYLYFRYQRYRLFQLACFLLLVRIAFNFLVLPTRVFESPTNEPAANRLASYDLVGFIEEPTILTVFNPFLQQEIAIPLINHLPYQFSYYYSRATQKVLPHVTAEDQAGFYLCPVRTFEEEQYRTPLDTIKMQGKRMEYVLYELKKE